MLGRSVKKMSGYDYPKIIARSKPNIEKLHGALVEEIVVQIVDPEFNVLFLKTDRGAFAMQGAIGSEIVEVVALESPFPEIATEEGMSVTRHPHFDRFISHRIESIREIGEAWNGHGYELSFSDIFDASMIVQSIYCSPKLEGLEDCLRLGVVSYQNTQTPNKPQHRTADPL